MQPYDFKAAADLLEERDGVAPSDTDLMSHVMYPDVYEEYVNFVKQYGNVGVLNTRAFVMGLEVGEEGEVGEEENEGDEGHKRTKGQDRGGTSSISWAQDP